MRKVRSAFLTEYIVNQYPLKKFEDLIFITLDIVENFLLELEEDFDYNSATVSSFDIKYGSNQKNNFSKVESICIKNMNDYESRKKFLSTFFNAYTSLNSEEKKVFDLTYIDRLTDNEIIEKCNTYYKYLRMVRRSAIIRFSLKAGLDKFIDLI